MKVPFDYSNPSIGEFTLHLRRHPAQVPEERIGSLLVNPGGPGFGGIFLAEQASSYYSSAITDHFDIVAWDPRGTGASTAIDCGKHLDYLFQPDTAPDTQAERTALERASARVPDQSGGSSKRRTAAPRADALATSSARVRSMTVAPAGASVKIRSKMWLDTTIASPWEGIDTTTITGNRELPKVMYVVPWKRADLGDLSGRPASSLLDEVLTPVDRDVFRRQLSYFNEIDPDRPGGDAAAAAPDPAH